MPENESHKGAAMKSPAHSGILLAIILLAFGPSAASADTIQWINHLGFISGDTSVTQTSFTSTLSSA